MGALHFVWRPTHAGAPDSDEYAGASDDLFLREDNGSDSKLQSFAKSKDDWHGVESPLDHAVTTWLANRPGQGRVVFLVHGYDFDPGENDKATFDDDPYDGVYRHVSTDEPTSWIPIVGADNAVCFAWNSLPSFTDAGRACWTNPYEYAVQDVAVLASRALAAVIAAFHKKGVTVDLFAHSLGTRVSCKAMAWLRDKAQLTAALRRVILVGGAEYSIDALADTRGLDVEIYNFAIRRDGVLQWGGSQLGGKQRPPNSMLSRVIGRDGVKRLPHWIDFQLDHSDPDNAEEFRRWFDNLGGYKLSGGRFQDKGLHWAYYLHPDNRALYRDILTNEALTIDWLRRQAAPDGIDRFRYQELSGTPPKTPMTGQGRHRLYDKDR
jgi:hypothetical protein